MPKKFCPCDRVAVMVVTPLRRRLSHPTPYIGGVHGETRPKSARGGERRLPGVLLRLVYETGTDKNEHETPTAADRLLPIAARCTHSAVPSTETVSHSYNFLNRRDCRVTNSHQTR